MPRYGHIADVFLNDIRRYLEDLSKALESVGTDTVRVKSV
jgi:hypothetical protein